MLRIIFSSEDLTRVRVARGPDFMWEIANSVQTLQRRDGARVFGSWRRTVGARLSPRSRMLLPLLPPAGYSPDFLTPTGAHEPDAAVDTVLSTPRSQLHADLVRLARERPLPAVYGRLAQGETTALRQLGASIDAYHRQSLAPFWPRIRARIEADRVLRLHALMDGGTERLLAGLGPQMRWTPPVLEIDYPVAQTLCLEGRGLTLQPSFFCWPRPVTLADPELPPVLVYPVQHDGDGDGDGGRPHGPGTTADCALRALLGPTRAAVLAAAVTGDATHAMAHRLGVSASAVSQHIAVLRDAGLVVTLRQSGRALHVATHQGRLLVRGARQGSLQ